MDCEKALELMSAELDGMCTEQERAALQAHLEACAAFICGCCIPASG